MSKRNRQKIIKLLWEVYDRLEGNYSNIPDCCVEAFIGGRTYAGVQENMSDEQVRKLHKWKYVPCEDCFKNDRINKVIKGKSTKGSVVWLLLQTLEERNGDKNERRASKRFKK